MVDNSILQLHAQKVKYEISSRARGEKSYRHSILLRTQGEKQVEYILEREAKLALLALTDTNRLVMQTCLAMGFRGGDVLSLTPDRLKSHFWITEQKTGKKGQVVLPEPLLSDLKTHAGEAWVFPGRKPWKPHTRRSGRM